MQDIALNTRFLSPAHFNSSVLEWLAGVDA